MFISFATFPEKWRNIWGFDDFGEGKKRKFVITEVFAKKTQVYKISGFGTFCNFKILEKLQIASGILKNK